MKELAASLAVGFLTLGGFCCFSLGLCTAFFAGWVASLVSFAGALRFLFAEAGAKAIAA
jgi:hypothetical protein